MGHFQGKFKDFAGEEGKNKGKHRETEGQDAKNPSENWKLTKEVLSFSLQKCY